jgi:hypothetical protein
VGAVLASVLVPEVLPATEIHRHHASWES